MKLNNEEKVKWRQVNEDGFGDPLNVSTRGIAVFDGYLYVGIMNGWNLQLTAQEKYLDKKEKNSKRYNKNWRGFSLRSIYSKGCKIYSTDGTEKSDGTLKWEPVVGEDAEGKNAKAGFGDENNWDASVLIPFNGYLYAGTFNPLKGCEIYRTKNGEDWEPVVGGGSEYIDRVGRKNFNGFGNANNKAAWTAIKFNDELYFGTMNWVDGCEIYKTKNGTDWEAVVGGDSSTHPGFPRIFGRNVYPWSMKEYKNKEENKNYLYLGTCSVAKPKPFLLGFLIELGLTPVQDLLVTPKPEVLSRGFQIWKSEDGKKWIPVVGRLGLLTEMPNGFGDPDNWGARRMEVFKGESDEESLFVGTAVNIFEEEKGCEVWRRYSNKKWKKVFGKENYRDPSLKYLWSMRKLPKDNELFVGLANPSFLEKRACQIWKTNDGKKWMKEETGDLEGDWGNRPRSMDVFQDKLYIGTYNFRTGCEVWKREVKQ